MLYKTKGIVIKTVKYTDNSSIATVYTREFGRIAFMVRLGKSKKASGKAARFMPLSQVEIDFYHNPKKNIQHIKDVRVTYQQQNIPYSPEKNAIALFVTESLAKLLRQPECDVLLYDFIENAIQILDNEQGSVANFHLVFMMQIMRFFGFEPSPRTDGNCRYFDMLNGIFVCRKPLHNQFLNSEDSLMFNQLLHLKFDNMNEMKLSRDRRNSLLNCILAFINTHIPDFGILKSFQICREIFD